jgi:hypothetical protein
MIMFRSPIIAASTLGVDDGVNCAPSVAAAAGAEEVLGAAPAPGYPLPATPR